MTYTQTRSPLLPMEKQRTIMMARIREARLVLWPHRLTFTAPLPSGKMLTEVMVTREEERHSFEFSPPLVRPMRRGESPF